MGLDGLITVLSGILFYNLSINSIIGIIYSYLETWKVTRGLIQQLQLQAANPVVKAILYVVKYSRYLAIPVIIWGLVWYTYYAKETV